MTNLQLEKISTNLTMLHATKWGEFDFQFQCSLSHDCNNKWQTYNFIWTSLNVRLINYNGVQILIWMYWFVSAPIKSNMAFLTYSSEKLVRIRNVCKSRYYKCLTSPSIKYTLILSYWLLCYNLFCLLQMADSCWIACVCTFRHYLLKPSL